MSRSRTFTAQAPPPVSWTTLHQRRRLLASFDARLGPQDFHILGAGVAGLVAAVEILAFRNPDGSPKHTVTIYEGSDRVGGRILTHRAGDRPADGEPDTRPYVELGAMRIPESHDYTWTYAREAGLSRRKFLNVDRTYEFEGRLYHLSRDLEKIVDAYGLTGLERGLVLAQGGGPGRLLNELVLKPEAAALDREYGSRLAWRRHLMRGVIEGDGLERLDRLTFGQVLDERVERRGLTPAGRRFLVDLGDLKDFLDRAFLMMILTEAANFGLHLWELCRPVGGGKVLGGMDQFVDGLVRRLPDGTIRTGREVRIISTDAKDEWKVTFADGESVGRQGKRDRHLLCTIPFSKLGYDDPAEIDLVGLTREKLDAIRGMSVVSATKIGLYCTRRSWPNPHGGGRSLTDRASRAAYYPNDGHEPDHITLLPEPGMQGLDGYGELPEEVYGLYTQPLDLDAGVEAVADESLPEDWILLSSYTYGKAADHMARQSARQTQQDLKPVFPDIERQTRPDDRTRSPVHSWRDHYWARGAFALPGPSTWSRHLLRARAPHRGIFFAGDGISFAPGWIQGAAFSALYALEHIQRTILGRGEPDPVNEDETST